MSDSELNSTLYIEQTKEWVNKLVIGLNFCPFAKREVQRNSIRYVPCPQKKQKDGVKFITG
ncbi:DUF1415 family protein [Aliiglaciecola lipolytica]|uniref:DUF1415 domain-containing protein n=1 Tax=Aliiglaciecola lipolytica E3 TaxID=1127673 RepID=K6X166_9ALTE|nr:DUF1415 family protein [Aliiglaciecola lipolytica]GAC14389.1 hypothetical protein GLIP_1756 [Aliiglaciecola lipolytica E3]